MCILAHLYNIIIFSIRLLKNVTFMQVSNELYRPEF